MLYYSILYFSMLFYCIILDISNIYIATCPPSTLNSTIRHYKKNSNIYATSDGILKEAVKGKDLSLLEVKCPFSGILPRFIRINDYLQMLLQMNCYQIDNMIHVVWIPSGFVIWYIENDLHLWNYIEENFINKPRILSTQNEWEENELLSIQIRISIERHSTKIGYYLDKNQYGQRIQIFFSLNRHILNIDLKDIAVNEMDTLSVINKKNCSIDKKDDEPLHLKEEQKQIKEEQKEIREEQKEIRKEQKEIRKEQIKEIREEEQKQIDIKREEQIDIKREEQKEIKREEKIDKIDELEKIQQQYIENKSNQFKNIQLEYLSSAKYLEQSFDKLLKKGIAIIHSENHDLLYS